MRRILTIVGTRPNFIKITQFRKAAAAYPQMDLRIAHTGQHHDGKMADVFFEQFGLVPDYFLDVSPGSSIQQIAEIMIRLEKVITEFRPDLLIVVGDVNSTLAAALTANKMGIRLAHVESGLRSFDRTMPEEFNRILTDELADFLFVTEQSGFDNLVREGNENSKIHFVGNTMIDTLVFFRKEIDASPVLKKLGLQSGSFALMTMHRPSSVDSKDGLEKILKLVTVTAKHYPIVFPLHPRTFKNLRTFGLDEQFRRIDGLLIVDPLDYFTFQKLVSSCKFILTDSGGIQEESTFMQVPCLTLRNNTERPSTITQGTNELVPFDFEIIESKIRAIMEGRFKKGSIPRLWDGHATERIFRVLADVL